MADFKPTKIDLLTINNGKGEYINGVDSVQADTINAVVEGTAWVQALGTNQPNNSEANNVGTPSVSIETLSDGTPRLKFDNLKGAKGEKGDTGTGILEYDSKSAFPATGETGKIYIDKSTNLTYRWSGSTYIQVGGGDLNLENGTGTGSLVQKRLKSDGVTWTTAKAYQGAGAAFGSGTQAGMTEDEFNTYFWDSVNNVPLHGGQGKNSLGEILDNVGLTYTKSYSFAFAANENNKAIQRASAAFGRYNTAHNIGEFVCGNYADNNRNSQTVFAVGTGIDDSRRSTGFEVRTNGYCYSYGKVIATEEYVGNRAVTKQGNDYVVYINEANGKSTVMPYRFNKQDIVGAAFPLMFQPMIDGRLYTRYPTDEYHTANKGYIDEKISKIDTKALKVTVW